MLILHIPRIGFNTKTNETFKIESELLFEIDDFIECEEHKYRLKFVIFHLGSIKSGHYIGINIKDRKILKYNDSVISEIEILPKDLANTSNIALLENW